MSEDSDYTGLPTSGQGDLRQRVEQCRQYMTALARRWSSSANEADDRVQAALIKALQAFDAHKYSETGKLCSWLRKLMYAAYVDEIRRLKQDCLGWTVRSADGFELMDGTDAADLDIDIENTPIRLMLADCISRLPEPQRNAFEWAALGLPQETIARKLGVSRSTVRTRLDLAREKMARCLHEKGFHDD